MEGIDFHSHSTVIRAVNPHVNSAHTLVKGMEEIAATNLIDLVQVLKAAGDDDKVAELRKSMMSLLEARNSLLRHKQSLETLAVGQHTYRPTGAVTNFEEELLKREQEILARMPTPIAEDSLYLAFEEAAAGNQAADPQHEQLDDDIAIEGSAQLAPNDRCPLSGKALMELIHPVADSKGFVYEEEVIQAHLRETKGRRRCPVAGTSHDVILAELRPAGKVIAAQRKAQREGRSGATGRAGAAPRGDVLDVDD